MTFRSKLKNTNDDNTELDSISWSLEKQTDDGGLIIVQRLELTIQCRNIQCKILKVIFFIKYDIKNYFIGSNFPETEYLNLGLICKTVKLN